MRKRFLGFAALVIVAAVGIWYLASPVPLKEQTELMTTDLGVTVGKTVPQFTLHDLSAREITVGRGDKVLVINFWTTWCPPCLAEMPELNRFTEKHPTDVLFYAVNIQETSSKVSNFMTQNNYRMQVLLDKDGSIAKNFRVSAIPTTLVVDKNGIVTYRKSGGITMNELESAIKGL